MSDDLGYLAPELAGMTLDDSLPSGAMVRTANGWAYCCFAHLAVDVPAVMARFTPIFTSPPVLLDKHTGKLWDLPG